MRAVCSIEKSALNFVQRVRYKWVNVHKKEINFNRVVGKNVCRIHSYDSDSFANPPPSKFIEKEGFSIKFKSIVKVST